MCSTQLSGYPESVEDLGTDKRYTAPTLKKEEERSGMKKNEENKKRGISQEKT